MNRFTESRRLGIGVDEDGRSGGNGLRSAGAAGGRARPLVWTVPFLARYGRGPVGSDQGPARTPRREPPGRRAGSGRPASHPSATAVSCHAAGFRWPGPAAAHRRQPLFLPRNPGRPADGDHRAARTPRREPRRRPAAEASRPGSAARRWMSPLGPLGHHGVDMLTEGEMPCSPYQSVAEVVLHPAGAVLGPRTCRTAVEIAEIRPIRAVSAHRRPVAGALRSFATGCYLCRVTPILENRRHRRVQSR